MQIIMFQAIFVISVSRYPLWNHEFLNRNALLPKISIQMGTISHILTNRKTKFQSSNTVFKFKKIHIVCVYKWVYVHIKTRRGYQIPWSWNCRVLRVAMQVLQIQPHSSAWVLDLFCCYVLFYYYYPIFIYFFALRINQRIYSN